MYSFFLLDIGSRLTEFKIPLLTYVSAFVLTLILIPPVIVIVKRFKLFDRPNARKEHTEPTPTFGGLAVFGGTLFSLLLWYKFTGHFSVISFFFSMFVLVGVGMMDDLKDLSARYKLIIQVGLASLMAISGVRIMNLGGLFAIHELHLAAQYTITVVTIVGITNAFNLIDGIDGLAGGLGFMSLMALGIFLTISNDHNNAIIAFAMAGGLLGFLYYNFNPARIFMGDTGSLVLGFVVAVLCVQLIKVNEISARPLAPSIGIFTLGIVFLPVFDTLRVFSIRLWNGRSPFSPDKTHIHHVITGQGFTHSFAARVIWIIHGSLLVIITLLKNFSPGFQVLILFITMLLIIRALKYIGLLKRFFKSDSVVSRTSAKA